MRVFGTKTKKRIMYDKKEGIEMEKFIHGETMEFVDWYDVDGNIINASDGTAYFIYDQDFGEGDRSLRYEKEWTLSN